jgi:signal transduction histidine kinase/ActR/RegA family two-component response regulator
MALRGPLMIANRISEHVAPNTLMWARQMGVALEREALRNEVAKQQAILLEAYERERSLASENARLYQQARQSEAALRQVNEALERRIAEATADLRRANAQLQAEIAQRAQAEEERLKLEQQLFEAQKLESLGVLAGGVAHDFNNLLVVILGNAGLALMDLSPDSPARASVEQIEIAARRAADLTRQLLAYAGRGRFVMQRLDLGALVADMIDLLKASIGKHVALQYQAPPTLPAIEADATQIRQVVMNLVINASEAIGAEPGTITITIGTRWIDQAFLHEAAALLEVPDGWYVCLAVSDTGCGMDDSTRARIFEPFYSTKFTGRGLGLSAVLGIVRSHKGTLTVQSMPGQGSTFMVLLPAIAAPAEAMPVPATRSGWQGHGTVLVVDDEPEVRTFAQRVLERSGLKVLTAADGVAAIEMLTAHAAEISCILLDLTMAHMGGEQAFAQIRRLRPELPVVVMSGYTAEDVASRFTGAYPTGFVQKPFTPQELRAALQQALEGTSSAAAGDREASGVADKQGGPP